MSRLDELEERVMTLERIVNNLKKEVLGENVEEKFTCSMFTEAVETQYVNKFIQQEDGNLKFMRVPAEES